MSKEDLLALFGSVILGKLNEAPTRHQMPGKHYYGAHGVPRPDPLPITAENGDEVRDADGKTLYHPKVAYRGKHRPTGSKLAKRFWGKNAE